LQIGKLLQCFSAHETQVVEQETGCQKTNQRRQVNLSRNKAQEKSQRDPANIT